jgi:hypothetical protein
MASGHEHEDCLRGVRAAIQALPLLLPDTSALPDARVYLREVPTDRNLTPPAIFVSIYPAPEEMEAGTNAAEDFGYGCQVTVVAAANQELDLAVGDYRLVWRQQIRDAFRFKRPAEVVSAVSVPLRYCRWQPLAVLDAEAYRSANLFVSAAVVWVLTREVR